MVGIRKGRGRYWVQYKYIPYIIVFYISTHTKYNYTRVVISNKRCTTESCQFFLFLFQEG